MDRLTPAFPAGFVHLPKIDAEFIQQLCAEQLITRRDRNGFPVREWQRCDSATGAADCGASTPAPPHRRRDWIASGTPLAGLEGAGVASPAGCATAIQDIR